MADHPIQSLMRTTMENLKAMVDVNTVVGDPVETNDGTVIIPVSRVSCGFVSGGADEPFSLEMGEPDQQQKQSQEQDSESLKSGARPFAGGSGAGVSVKPVGFLVVGDGRVRFLPVDTKAVYDRLIDAAPDIIKRVAGILGVKVEEEGASEEQEEDDDNEFRNSMRDDLME